MARINERTKMKLNKIGNRLAIGVLLTIAATGCKTNPRALTNIPDHRSGMKDTAIVDKGLPITPTDSIKSTDDTTGLHPLNPRGAHDGWIVNADAFKAYTAHFDFDSSNVRATDKDKLEAVAAELKANPLWAVRVEGNCDERGTEEYNRSLGERRALVLRESLIALGIDPSRIDNISYGEDKPIANGHDEAAWSQNRRGDFIQLTPPKQTFLSDASDHSNP
jgi:peptidoglycan-associated lipoprotein